MGKYYTLKWNLLSVLAIVLASLTTKAQVSSYLYSQTSTTYTAITSSDSLGTATSDDQRYVDPAVPAGGTATTGVGFPIGFNFVFNSDTFDRIAINNNGWISFGKSSLTPSVNNASTSAYTPLSSTTTITPSLLRNRIAVVGRDLQAQAGASIRYKVLGASPNQVYVLQWENFKRYGTTGTGDTLNFQLRLYETTNVVEVVFGNMKFGTGTSTTTSAPHVGLGGSVATDFNNRTTTTDWNNTAAGGANNVGCAVNTGVVYPVSGTVFKWTPATCFAPTSVSVSPVGTDTAVVNWLLPTQVTPQNFQWVVVPQGNNPSTGIVASGFVAGTATSVTVNGLTSASSYTVYVRSVCSAGDSSNYTTAVNFSTQCPAQFTAPYCQNFENAGLIPNCWSQGVGNAEPWRFANTGSGNHIGNNGVITGTTSSNGYFAWVDDSSPNSLNTTLESPSIDVSGLTNPLLQFYMLSNNEGFSNVFFRVAVFDGSVWHDSVYTHNTNTVGGWELMSVPLNGFTFSGPLKLRFIVNESNGTDFYDDVAIDDICVFEAPACPAPTAASVGTVTDVTASINWSATGAGTNVEYGPAGFTPGTGTTIHGVSSPYTIIGLTPQTAYSVYLTDSCSGGALSSATGPLNFTTLCSPYPYPGDSYVGAIVVNSYPFNDTVSTTDPCYTDASPLRAGTDVFYRIVADSCASQITFSLCGSDFDTYLYIRDSANTTTLFSNDDFCSLQSEITFSPAPGATYIAIAEPYSSGTTGTFVVNVSQVTGAPTATTSFTSPSCAGIADGSAGVAVNSFAIQPVTYLWSNGGTNDTIANISSGTYYVTVTTACGTVVDSVVIPAAFNASVTTTSAVSCNGGNDGAIDVTITSGTQPYTFVWSNGALTEDISNLVAGTYCLTVTENGGCSATVCGVVSEPAAIAIAGNVDSALCAGSSDGEIDLTVTGGTQNVVNAQLSTIFSGGNGCTAGNMFNLQAAATVDLTQFDINIATGNYPVSIYYKTGTYLGFETTAAAWTQIYSGNVTGLGNGVPTPVVLPSAFNLPAGQYAFYVDADVDYTNQAVGTAYSTPELTLTVGVGLCTAFSGTVNVGRAWNGNIHYTKTDGYDFLWSNGDTTEDVSGLAAGVYSVTITDYNSCTATQSFTVSEPLPILPSLDSLVNVSCNGGTNGAVYITVAGGTTPYSFSWSNGSTSEDLVGVGAGIYTGTITDANGCTFVSPQVPITEPTAIAISVDSVTNVTCNAAANGAVDVSVSGGTPGYSYLWSNSAITEDLSGLSGGSFTLTVTDNNGCTAVGSSANVVEPAALTVFLDSVLNNVCNGDNHGNSYVTADGGTTPYTFNWSNNSTNEDLTQVAAGNYSLTVTDANGCSAGPLFATITEPAVVTIALDSVWNVLCNGDSNAAVYVTVSGGTGSYTYNWNTGSTSEDITSLAAGTYDLTATDVNGCTASFSQAVTEPTALNPSVDSIVNVACFGASTGGIYISVTGGTTPYSFSWSNGGSNEDLVGIPAGSYIGTLTDANGCVSISPALAVTGPSAALSASSVATNQIQGGAQGSVNLSVSGGTSPYSYNWSNGATTEDLSSVAAGIYTCTITDANGCTVTQKDTVDLIIGIENVVAAYAVNLYPNPTQNNVTVDVTLPVAADVTVMVYSVEGKLISSMEEKQIANAKFTFSFMDEAEGVYFARIMVDGNVSTHRIVVTR